MKNSINEACAAFIGGGPQMIACPNCWGTQEWEADYKSKSITASNKPKAFIQKFVDKYLTKKK